MSGQRHIRILMGTLNGAAHLREQLDSIAAQTHRDWSLTISDDGSCDATLDIARDFAARHPGHDIALIEGPRQGASANYFALLAAARPAPGDLVALSDQDDIWFADKLERAAAQIPEGAPTAYGSALELMDMARGRTRPSRRCPRGPSFENALLQNILSGNSLVLNPAAVALLQANLPDGPVPFHDWWIYQVITGAGARAIHDPRPSLRYRQHEANVIGGNRGLAAFSRRMGMLRNRHYRDWIGQNLAALARAEGLTPAARAKVARLAEARARGGPATAAALLRLGLHRQSPIETAGVIGTALLGRL